MRTGCACPSRVVRRVREAVGTDFIIIYRLSMIDLVPNGSTYDEVVQLAKAVEKARATIINTGIGWHEARIPTIATSVPRAAFPWVTKKLMGEVSIPVITSNRINTPEVGEEVCHRLCRHGVDGAPHAGGCAFRGQSDGGQEPPRSRRVSRATKPVWITPLAARFPPALVNPRACYETELDGLAC